MILDKTNKYKLRLNNPQERKFKQWLGCTRLVYNLAKEVSEYHYEATGKPLSKYDLQRQVIQLKKDYDWMRELPKDTLVEPCFRFDKAMKAFFKGGGYPNWATKRKWNSLVFIQQNKTGLRIENGKIKLHKGIRLRYFNSRNLPAAAKIKQIIITKEIDGWYASIQFATESHVVTPANDSQVVGVDMGVVRLATLSTGEYYENPKIFNQYRRKLRIEQRSLSRKKKGSANWRKQVRKLAKLYRKTANVRDDHQHKTTTEMVGSYGGFVVENLQVSNMTRSARGNAEKHGKNVRQKSGLNRSLLGVAPYSFLFKLEYKAKWSGRSFERIKAAYSSQECSNCGHVSKENRKSQARFECKCCSHSENADVNAAKVIKGRGTSFVRKRKAAA